MNEISDHQVKAQDSEVCAFFPGSVVGEVEFEKMLRQLDWITNIEAP